MKKYLVLFILILIQGCSSGGGDSNTSTVTNSVIGAWSLTYPNSGCIESYTFLDDDIWTESALDEIQAGTYTFVDTVNVGERHALSVVVASDNGLPDCEGISDDATGVSATVYASFPSESVMEWYTVSTGGIVEAVLTKSPTPVTSFSLFPPNYFTSYNDTMNLSGSNSAGDKFFVTISEQTGLQTTFLGEPAVPIVTAQSIFSTSGVFFTVNFNRYYSTSASDRRYLGDNDGGEATVSAVTTAIPPTAKIGEFGVIGTYIDNTGEVKERSWRLEEGGNGRANLVIYSNYTDQSGNFTGSETRIFLIDESGNRITITSVGYDESTGGTITLSGS